MSLLYIKEHLSCREYSSPENAIVRIHNQESSTNLWEGYVANSLIAFLMKGKIIANCGSYTNIEISEGELFFIPNNSYVSGFALEEVQLITVVFDTSMNLCSRFSLENLVSQVKLEKVEYDFTILPIRPRLLSFLSLLEQCLSDGLGCMHYHNSKRNELMLMLRAYYTKEELACLFYPALSVDLDIKDFALSNYNKVKDVKEFASLAKMSSVTFNRKFKKIFGESAAHWLEKQKSKDILQEIEQTNKTFAEIAESYNFSSPAYFVTFCKRNFSKTPKELREGFKQDLSKK